MVLPYIFQLALGQQALFARFPASCLVFYLEIGQIPIDMIFIPCQCEYSRIVILKVKKGLSEALFLIFGLSRKLRDCNGKQGDENSAVFRRK